MAATAVMGAAQYKSQGAIGDFNQAVNNRNALVLEQQSEAIERKTEFNLNWLFGPSTGIFARLDDSSSLDKGSITSTSERDNFKIKLFQQVFYIEILITKLFKKPFILTFQNKSFSTSFLY